MKKLTKSIVCIALAVLMLTLLTEPAMAATGSFTYSVKKVEAGTVYTGKNTWDSENSKCRVIIYKIVVPESGYITVKNSYSFSSYVSGQGNLFLYRTLSKAKAGDSVTKNSVRFSPGDYLTEISEKSTSKIPLTKGTYYIRTCNDTGYKFKYTFTKAAIPVSNTVRAKAITLSANTTKTINIPVGYEGARWYKIKLTSKKILSITFKDLTKNEAEDEPDFALYTSTGERIGVVHGDGWIYKSAKKLEAGTYYIKVMDESWEYSENWSRLWNLYTIRWK